MANSAIHYYTTLSMFVEAGYSLDAAKTIATANQMVDHAQPGNVPNRMPGLHTQSYDYQWFRSREYLDPFGERWTVFHFGGRGAWKKGRACKENDGSEQSVETVGALRNLMWLGVKPAGLPVEDLIEAGIALHTWQDSYTHQGFRGWRHEANRAGHWWISPVPALGHADYGSKVDSLTAKAVRGPKESNRERLHRMASHLWAEIAPDRILPSTCQSIERASNEADLKKHCLDIVERRTGERPEFKPFDWAGENWRAFCQAASGV